MELPTSPPTIGAALPAEPPIDRPSRSDGGRRRLAVIIAALVVVTGLAASVVYLVSRNDAPTTQEVSAVFTAAGATCSEIEGASATITGEFGALPTSLSDQISTLSDSTGTSTLVVYVCTPAGIADFDFTNMFSQFGAFFVKRTDGHDEVFGIVIPKGSSVTSKVTDFGERNVTIVSLGSESLFSALSNIDQLFQGGSSSDSSADTSASACIVEGVGLRAAVTGAVDLYQVDSTSSWADLFPGTPEYFEVVGDIGTDDQITFKPKGDLPDGCSIPKPVSTK